MPLCPLPSTSSYACAIPQSSLWTTLFPGPGCFLSHHSSYLSQVPGTSFVCHTLLWLLIFYFVHILKYLPSLCSCWFPPQSQVLSGGNGQGYGASHFVLAKLGKQSGLLDVHCLDGFPKPPNCPSQVQCSRRMLRTSTFET